MSILKKIWRWFIGLFGKKKPVNEVQDFQILQLVTDKWEEPEPHTEQSFDPPIVKRVFDTTKNPNKYWRRFKRGNNFYWKKFYSNG